MVFLVVDRVVGGRSPSRIHLVLVIRARRSPPIADTATASSKTLTRNYCQSHFFLLLLKVVNLISSYSLSFQLQRSHVTCSILFLMLFPHCCFLHKNTSIIIEKYSGDYISKY